MLVTAAQTQRLLAEFLLQQFPHIQEEDLADDAPLLSSGRLDSLGVLELTAFIESSFAVRVQDSDMVPAHFERLSYLVSFVEQRLPTSP